MKKYLASTIAALLIIAVAPTPHAEYLIYLKGGHYIVADGCTFWSRQGGEGAPKGEEESILADECKEGKPEGRVFWSTIDGSFGEVNAEDVYIIFGSRSLAPVRTPRATKPLEDYLITNRGESFVNAKIFLEREGRVYGLKRDDIAKVNRRGVTEIAPEGEAKSRSGEGLCPGEPVEFSVTETELVDGYLGGVVTNLSPAPWKIEFYVEVREKGKFRGKFPVIDINVLSPGESIPIYERVKPEFLEYIKRVTDPEASVQLCYRKVKTGAGQPIAAQPGTGQPAK